MYSFRKLMAVVYNQFGIGHYRVLENQIGMLRRALALAEHDQIDFVYEVKASIVQAPNAGARKMRTLRYKAAADRLEITREVLRATKPANNTPK